MTTNALRRSGMSFLSNKLSMAYIASGGATIVLDVGQSSKGFLQDTLNARRSQPRSTLEAQRCGFKLRRLEQRVIACRYGAPK